MNSIFSLWQWEIIASIFLNKTIGLREDYQIQLHKKNTKKSHYDGWNEKVHMGEDVDTTEKVLTNT